MPNASDVTRRRRPRLEVFSSFTPDQPALESDGLTYIQNTFPLPTGKYGPVRDLSAESLNAISDLDPTMDRTIGTIGSFRDLETGAVTLFAGALNTTSDSLRIFAYQESQRIWRDVTRSDGPYTFSTSRAVRFVQHGSTMFACVGRSHVIQKMTIGTDDRFSDITGAPRPTDIAVVREFLVGINFNLSTESFPDFVMWSAQVEPTSFPTPGTIEAQNANSGFAQIPGGGRLQRIIPGVGGSDAIIVGETRLWRMTLVGRPSIWQFDVAAFDQGTTVPGSVSSVNEKLFFLGRDGFQVFDGSSSTPIGAGQVDDAFLNDAIYGAQTISSRGNQAAVTSAIDTERKLYLVSYRTRREEERQDLETSTGQVLETSDDLPIEILTTASGNNALWAFNYQAPAWGHAYLAVDTVGLVDTQRTSLDTPRLVAIGPDLNLSLFRGENLEAIFEGPERVANGGNRETVYKLLVGSDATNILASLLFRDELRKPLRVTQELSFDNDGYCSIESSGVDCRYWRVRLRIPEGEDWTFMLGCQVEMGDWGMGPIR